MIEFMRETSKVNTSKEAIMRLDTFFGLEEHMAKLICEANLAGAACRND